MRNKSNLIKKEITICPNCHHDVEIIFHAKQQVCEFCCLIF